LASRQLWRHTFALLLVTGIGATDLHGSVSQQPVAAQEGVVVPGGKEFVRSYLGMVRGRGKGFLYELAEYLQEPGMRTRAVRLDKAIAELVAYEGLLRQLRGKHGSGLPSLAQPEDSAYAKARDLMDWFGVRHVELEGSVSLELGGGDSQELRREVFAHLGYDIDELLPRWESGEPIDMSVPEEMVPVLFGSSYWKEEVFQEDLTPTALLREFLLDEEARWVMLGYARLDPDTRDLLRATMGLREAYRDRTLSVTFPALAHYLRSDNGALALPGESRIAWTKILGSWSSPSDLVERLVNRDDGRALHLWRALSLVPPRRARYLLTLGATDPESVERWADDLYGSIRAPGGEHALRWRGDLADLFLQLPLRSNGEGIAWLGGGQAWIAALQSDGVVSDHAALEEELRDERVRAAADHGPAVDAEILRQLVAGFEGSELRQGTHAIERFVAIQAAFRYQPAAATPETITLLYRNYDRLAQAYGFVVGPTSLEADEVEQLIYFLVRAQSPSDERQREAAARQAQSTLLIFKRLLDNGQVAEEQRHEVLEQLLNLPLDQEAGGFGRGLADWWRQILLPAIGGEPGAGHEGNFADAESISQTLVAALADQAPATEMTVDGIQLRFSIGDMWAPRIHESLQMQRLAPFGHVVELDAMAAEYEDKSRAELGQLGDEIEARMRPVWNALRDSVATAIYEGDGDDQVRLPLQRADLPEQVERLLGDARRNENRPEHFEEVRKYLASWLTDSLVAVVYAIHINDPRGLYFNERQPAWLHRLGPLQDSSRDTGPWRQTREAKDAQFGLHFQNSLLGVPRQLGQWALRLQTMRGEVSYAAQSVLASWCEAVFGVQSAALSAESLEALTARMDRAVEWVQAAAASANPALSPPWLDSEHAVPTLEGMVNLLHRPADAWRLRRDIAAGDARSALAGMTPGDRYLLAWGAEDLAGAIDPAQRWEADSLVGLPYWRGAGTLGVTHPSLVPKGEGADAVTDGLLYARLLGVRVELARGLAENGYPAALAVPLLLPAMGAALQAVDPDTATVWDEIAIAVPNVVTPDTVRDWVLDLAFNEDLAPATTPY
jgi:hypothetical protein